MTGATGQGSARPVGLAGPAVLVPRPRGLRDETRRAVAAVADRVRRRGVLAFPVTLAVVGAVLALARLRASGPAGAALVDACCGLRAGLPLPLWLLRLPGSLAAPAAHLPEVGSVVQVLLALGLAEAVFGSRRTVLLAGTAHVVATLAAKFFVLLGPTRPFGLPASYLWAADSGPSAATVALAVALAVALPAPRWGALVVGSVLVTSVLSPGLASREHLVAVLVGVAFAVAYRVSRAADPWARLAEVGRQLWAWAGPMAG